MGIGGLGMVTSIRSGRPLIGGITILGRGGGGITTLLGGGLGPTGIADTPTGIGTTRITTTGTTILIGFMGVGITVTLDGPEWEKDSLLGIVSRSVAVSGPTLRQPRPRRLLAETELPVRQFLRKKPVWNAEC